MSIKYGKFEMPQEIILEEDTATDTFARFIAEPLERGIGHTLGNSMRRLMLTSIEAPGIISIRLKDVPHEYMAVEGIVEDMTNVILNLKGAKLRKLPLEETTNVRDQRILTKVIEVTQEDIDNSKGQYVVKLGDIIDDNIFEIVNPNLPIFIATKPMQRQIDLRVAFGRGYVPSERHHVTDKMMDEILIDTVFSPVSLVHYHVENTRVGQDTDFDKLILEVTTDGRITPTEALGFASQIAIKHYDIFSKIQTHKLSFEEIQPETDNEKDDMIEKLCRRIDEIELSVRSTNCIRGANIESIAELVIKSRNELLGFRNFGKKSLNEIDAKLSEMNMSLGMDLSRYDITPENVKEKTIEYQEKHPKKDFTIFEE